MQRKLLVLLDLLIYLYHPKRPFLILGHTKREFCALQDCRPYPLPTSHPESSQIISMAVTRLLVDIGTFLDINQSEM